MFHVKHLPFLSYIYFIIFVGYRIKFTVLTVLLFWILQSKKKLNVSRETFKESLSLPYLLFLIDQVNFIIVL